MDESALEVGTRKHIATATQLIRTEEQEYVDPDRQYAHNDIYPTTRFRVLQVLDARILVTDNTGDLWIPRDKVSLKD